MTTVFHYRKKQYALPQEYNALTGKQLVLITGIMHQNLPEEVAKLKALKVLLNKTMFCFGLMSNDVKERLLPFCDWVFEKNTLTKNLVPFYDDMFGPADGFDNLCMGEWNACEIYYDEIVNGEDQEHSLNKLIAVLYRLPKKHYNLEMDPDGDARLVFNVNLVDYYKNRIARWPQNVKLAILHWFDGCRNDIIERYDLFGKPAEGEQQPGMFEVIRQLCGSKYGTFEKVEAMNVHMVLLELYLMKKEAEEVERQMKST